MVHSRFSKSIAFDFASTDMQEEASPWRWLPRDILERALAFLPLPEVLRLRCVCKRWNDLIHCAQFQSRVAWGPFFLLEVDQIYGRGSRVVSWSSYDFGERKWISMPLLEFPLQSQAYWLVASDGGLVCFTSLIDGRVLVYNPLTNKWKELPSWRSDFIHTYKIMCCMIVDKQRNSYKILFAGNTTHGREDPRYGKVDLYDSMTNTWSCGQDMSVGNRALRGAYCNGEFYILTQHRLKGPYAVVRLQLTTLRWREETIPIPEGCMRCPLIIACLGQVYLVGGRNDTHSCPLPSVVIFQLDQSNKWTKVSEYSDEHFLGFLGEIRGCWSDGLKMHMVAKLEGSMWLGVYNYATSCWEEPIHRGNDLHDFYSTLNYGTMITYHPNFQVVP